ncbi:MAG: Trehalose/maltose import ATP-binding protein MalK [Methanocella sp. PtaU1.Bin125]|nr:MAG: Trehalose/maltose import ATP-binding protein MalK [Methanocella sp. PtaU1.Bin125]
MSLKAEDVSYRYPGAGGPAISSASLEIGKGELVVVCGKNGSGKSTLIRCLAGLIKPSQGRVSIDGQAPEKARRAIGFAVQFPERALFERTVCDEVAFGPRNMGLPPDEVDRLTGQAIDAVGISRDLMSVAPRSLSYGRKRLVAIACAIAHRPGYLFLDEPAAGLDYEGRTRITGLIKSLKAAGMTVIVASHDPLDLLDICDRLVVLDGGRVVADGPPSVESLGRAGITSDTIELARRLQSCGINVREAFSPEALADSIVEALK